MKKGKKLLALVVVISLLAGLAPTSSTSYAEETEATLNETLLLSDDFSGDGWNTSTASPVGYWRLDTNTTASKNYAGSIDTTKGTAPLGNLSSNRNLYASKENDGKLSDVHIKSKVCVTSEYTAGTYSQYHLLFARGEATGTNGVAFGFKTEDNPAASSLIVGLYGQNDVFTSVYMTTDAKYSLNKEYELELYVIGESFIIAKCDGETIFADAVSGISESGYCGILDRRASSKTDTATYGENGYQKGGYFDDFSISSITLDGFKVNGPVVIERTGAGVADVTITSGGVEVADLQDASVTVEDLAGKGCSLYEGNYSVTTDVLGEEMTAVSDRIFVVDSLENAVTSMNDERWTGATVDDSPNFTVNDSGKATLTNSKYSVLSMATDTEGDEIGYNQFYTEYTLTVSDIASGKRNWYSTCFNTVSRAAYSAGGFTADVLHDFRTGASYEEFYARLQNRTANDTVDTYSKGTTDDDVALGHSMTIGLWVYSDEIVYTLDGNVVAEYRYDAGATPSTGWLALYNDIESGSGVVVTVEDFIYVPLTDKMVVDLEVSEIEDVQIYGDITTPTVTPIYSWPNDGGETTTENVTVEGFDNTKAGKQTVTVMYTEDDVTVSKEVTVNVVDESIQTIISEDFEASGLTNSNEWATLTNVDTVTEGKLVMDNASSAKMSSGINAGYLEATLSITETSSTTLAKAVDFRYQVDNKNYIILRLTVVEDTEKIATSKLQIYVYIDGTQASSAPYTISDFAINTQYKICFKVIGNYVEVEVNDAVIQKLQCSLGNTNDLITGTGTFAFETTSNATVTMDDLSIVQYTPYTISKDETITLQDCTYTDISDSSQSWVRNAFHSGEKVVLAVSEDSQLAVGGLTYTLDGVTDSATYSVFERLYDKDTNPEVCNQFKFIMPSCDITLKDKYYDATSEEANIGARDTGIRESEESIKRGLRFSSRAYTTYTSDETRYTLKEVGTLLLNGDVAVEEATLTACYATKSSEENKGLYYQDDVLIGKCIPATKALNICEDFWDWGVVLTYADSYAEGTTNLYAKEYQAYAYAVYEDANGNEVVKYASEAKSAAYSYNSVAEAIGWTTY